jgi:hypothetical protein
MRIQVRKALFGFVDARSVTSRHPPQPGISAREGLEPLMSLPKQFHMRRAVNVVIQRFDGLPNRHVEQDSIVVVGPQVCSVSPGSTETPNEARAAIGESVDLVDPGGESRHQRVVQRSLHSSNVYLCDVVLRHLLGSVQSRVYQPSLANGGCSPRIIRSLEGPG